MDKRIGYGLTLEKAIETALKKGEENVVHFSFTTKHHDVIWAEKRFDGWRVYVSSN